MVKHISVTQLRERTGEYLDRADLSRETFIITRKGRGKAVLVSPEEYIRLLEERDALRDGKQPPEPSRNQEPTLSLPDLKTLVR